MSRTGDLLLAGRQPPEKQARHVRARDEQHERNRREQCVERRPKVAGERADEVSRLVRVVRVELGCEPLLIAPSERRQLRGRPRYRDTRLEPRDCLRVAGAVLDLHWRQPTDVEDPGREHLRLRERVAQMR
jgi:hypothetical protein